MEGGYREFDCGICGKHVWISKSLYRGHKYCSDDCSHTARRESLRRARRRHQKTEEGRRGNARRQREYRRRHKVKPDTEVESPGVRNGSVFPRSTTVGHDRRP